MLSEAQEVELNDIWTANCQGWMFAYSDGLSYEAFVRGYSLAKGWDA